MQEWEYKILFAEEIATEYNPLNKSKREMMSQHASIHLSRIIEDWEIVTAQFEEKEVYEYRTTLVMTALLKRPKQ